MVLVRKCTGCKVLSIYQCTYIELRLFSRSGGRVVGYFDNQRVNCYGFEKRALRFSHDVFSGLCLRLIVIFRIY